MRRHRFACITIALLLLPAVDAAAAGDYKAQRFDVVARAMEGNLEVTETIVFEFQSGTFTRVWRDLPASRTDGINVIDVIMDGVRLPAGDGPGTYSLGKRNGTRVEWRFGEVGPSVHRFELRYLARGVVYREGTQDVIRWRALPQEHGYRIDASRIQFEPGGADVRPPNTRRVGSVETSSSNEAVTIDVANVQSNGWIIADLRYPAGELVAQNPEWLVREERARESAPTWALGGAALLVPGLLLVAALRQRYSAPATPSFDTTTTEPPQPLPAALASVLTWRGGLAGYQPAVTILDLADRGVLSVREKRGTFARSYELSRVGGRHDLESHEQEALRIAFGDDGDVVPMSKARGRLARASRRFSAAVNADLGARGWIDPDRKAARGRLTKIALLMILGAALAAIGLSPLLPRYQGWPFLVPLGLVVAGIVGCIAAATITPLSDQGLVEAARWRGFKRHLKTIASRRYDGGADVPPRWIVYAIAAGLAYQWSRLLKRRPDLAPAWFLAAGPDSGAAFAVFVGGHSGGGAGGGGGGGGGAAGGGGSGAG